MKRRHLVAVRARVGLVQWLALAMIPPLVLPLFSPAIGETYSVVSSLAHGFCLFVAGTAFYSLALLLSTVFGDQWRPLLIALLVATVMGLPAELASTYARYTLSGVMGGETFFRTGQLPWLGLLVSAGEISRLGQIRTKADNLRELGSGALKLTSVKYDSLSVRIYGDVAVLQGVADNMGTFRGFPFAGKLRYTRIFVKRDGRWQAVAMQHTMMP